MRIQTFSILAGSEVCNARCPFCISKMTPPLGVEAAEPEVNWRNFRVACTLAQRSGVTTAMITGKGEPTVFPGQIRKFLKGMEEFRFPLTELQTNGILLWERSEEYAEHLMEWYRLGLTTIAISVVHHDPEKNRQIYLPDRERYIDLPELIATLHRYGFSVRLAAVMAGGFIDGRDSLSGFVEFARANGVEQVTVRPVNRPGASRSEAVHQWAGEHHLGEDRLNEIREYLEEEGVLLMTLVHGALVYDVGGQNVCLTDSLTIDAHSEDVRQLIFFPDGHLRYDWQRAGAILL